jgi:hypothetical protein
LENGEGLKIILRCEKKRRVRKISNGYATKNTGNKK